MSQVQKVPCHQTAHFCVVLIDGIYGADLLLVADDDQRNIPCHLLHLADVVRVRIAGINDSLGCHCADHPQIFLLKSCITLGIADENPIPPLIRHSLNALQKQHIIRACDGGAEYNDQLLFFVFFFASVPGKTVAQLAGGIFYLFYGLPGKRNVIFVIQHHGNGSLGNPCFLCYIG